MPDDEPLDDARAVATAGAATAARLTETVARHVADSKARERATIERAEDQRRAQQTLAQLGGRYDSTEQRGQRDAVREEAGVPAEARRVVAIADEMNGTNPQRAAAVGTTTKARAKAPAKVPQQQRGR